MATQTASHLSEGDLLYHCVHGLCRLDRVLRKNDGKEGIFYSLIPHAFKKNGSRFVFLASDLESTGFHTLVSVADAHAILGYFKKGAFDALVRFPKDMPSFAEENKTWALAKFILSCARGDLDAKDKRRRENLKRAARGLIIELAFVLQLPLRETIFQVRKNLESTGKIDPLVLTALTDAGEE